MAALGLPMTPQRIGGAGAQHMPDKEAWLVGEHRSDGERKCCSSNLPADTAIKEVAVVMVTVALNEYH